MIVAKNNLKVLFIGTRWKVLEKILSYRIKVVSILTPKGSYLEEELKSRKIDYHILISKNDTIKKIENTDFNILVSNGCPYILPISRLKKNGQLFINIHPSILPDLRGGSPVNGAILFNKPAGATCHVMDDNVDTGPIISQVNVRRTDNIDLGLLYQLCFLAEADTFEMAYKGRFKPLKNANPSKTNTIYYTRRDTDLLLDFNDKPIDLMRKIKAFGVQSQGAYFFYKNCKYKVLDAKLISNKFLLRKINNYKNGEIIFKYESSILVKLRRQLIELCGIIGNIGDIKIGGNIFSKKVDKISKRYENNILRP